jgi:putative hydrolase of HD superfamily
MRSDGKDQAGHVKEDVLRLGQVALQFGRTMRITRHEDGIEQESDTDHTVMLGLLACALSYHFPGLNTGRIAEFALVHDLVEVFAGDTSTLRQLSEAEEKAKNEREASAYFKLQGMFHHNMRWIGDRIKDYLFQIEAEARFVRAVDKL